MADINVSNPVSAAIDFASAIVKRVWPDKSEEEQRELTLLLTTIQGQNTVNAAEAGNPSVFVSGWRPFVGWVCGGGFAVQFVVGPLIAWGCALAGVNVTPPTLDLGTLSTLLLGMLGLGGLRTVERVNGAALNGIAPRK